MILPPDIWGDGEPAGVQARAAQGVIDAAKAAKKLGVEVVNGFTGSSIWHYVYSFPPVTPDMIEAGYADFAKRFTPILDAFKKEGVKFGLEVHPTEIAFDIASAQRAIDAVKGHECFGFNYDPSHLGYQGVDYVKFIRTFGDRIFHSHMKDVWWGHGEYGICRSSAVLGLPVNRSRRYQLRGDHCCSERYWLSGSSFDRVGGQPDGS